jgi:hypothetical protein
LVPTPKRCSALATTLSAALRGTHGLALTREPSNLSLGGSPDKFAEPTTLYFSGREDPGGGLSRGSGRAAFQAIPNKSWPDKLTGSISFATLQKGHPVSGSCDFATLDGKNKFNGHFQAICNVPGAELWPASWPNWR